MTHPIYPCLWFDGRARAAAELYCQAFPDSQVTSEGPVVVTFTLDGLKFMGLDGGPRHRPNASISFYATFESLAEIDRAWRLLSQGGSVSVPLDRQPWSERYGWVQDRFGVSWQLAQGRLADVGRRIAPMFSFAGDRAGAASQAIAYYSSVFEPSSVAGIRRYEPGGAEVAGTVEHAQFWLGEQVFMAMDSSQLRDARFDEGVSLVIECESQQEIDHYWNALTAGGREGMCGWLEDRFGVAWQVVPARLSQLMSDPARTERVRQAFLKMKKFDILALERA